MKKILTVLLAAVMLTALVVPAFAADDVAYVDYSKKNTNDGLTAATAKQSFDASGKGVVGVIPNGGTLVASGKLYFGGNYTIKIPVTITANYDGVDYKNPEPAKNPTSGQMKMSGGSTLTIQSDVVIDDIILFQEQEQNTIVVADGGSLTVTDKVVCMTYQDYYMNIEVQDGGKAVLNGGIFENVTGDGDITIADNVVVKSEGDTVPSTDTSASAASGVAFINHATGSDGNSGTSVQYPKKLFGKADGNGVMSLLTEGGTLVATGKAFVGADFTFPKTANPLIVTSYYDGVNYKAATPATNPDCAFKMASGKTLTIEGETTFDNIILFQEGAQNTILVKEGAVLTVTDTVDLLSKTEYHFKVVLESGAKAILSEKAQKTFAIENNGGTVETYASSATVVKLTIGSMTGYVNGEAKTLDAAPIIKNSRTMLPVRFVAENLGGTVGWDGATSSVTITGDGIDIAIKIGASTAQINGKTVTLDAPAFIESSRTYLPVRVVAEAMGATVEWDGATSTATLTK